ASGRAGRTRRIRAGFGEARVELAQEGGHARKPDLARLRDRTRDQIGERLRRRLLEHRRVLALLDEHAGDQLALAQAGEEVLAGIALVHHHAERVDVDRTIELFLTHLLRRAVLQRADGDAGARQLLAVELLGDAEIHHHHATRAVL